MNTKLVYKLFTLLAGLVFFIVGKSYVEGGAVKDFFSSFEDKSTKINWCATHTVDFVWISEKVPGTLKQLDSASLRNSYCELKTEDISGIDIDKVQWVTLAESAGAAGAKAVLEWNPENKLFRSGGLPFKSSKLSEELGL